jgi:hypothetical protein
MFSSLLDLQLSKMRMEPWGGFYLMLEKGL